MENSGFVRYSGGLIGVGTSMKDGWGLGVGLKRWFSMSRPVYRVAWSNWRVGNMACSSLIVLLVLHAHFLCQPALVVFLSMYKVRRVVTNIRP